MNYVHRTLYLAAVCLPSVAAADNGSPLVDLLRLALRLQPHTEHVSAAPARVPELVAAAGYALDAGTVLVDGRTGTQAYVAARADEVVVAFSYTGAGEGWLQSVRSKLTDARFALVRPAFPAGAAGHVHRGYRDAYGAHRAAIVAAVQRYPERPIRIVGHSLGGALSALATYDLAVTLRRPVTGLAFASPRVGNANFVAGLTRAAPGAFHRFELEVDPVPRLPPWGPIGQYQHAGDLLLLRVDGGVVPAADLRRGLTSRFDFQAHYPAAYVRALSAFAAACATTCERLGGMPLLTRTGDAERAHSAKLSREALSFLRRWLRR